jgi:hypothetical protein
LSFTTSGYDLSKQWLGFDSERLKLTVSTLPPTRMLLLVCYS